MKCPQCGEINPQGFKFCRACGEGLKGGPPPKSGSPAPPAAKSRREGKPDFQLVATQGPLSGRQFKIGAKGLTIGRDPQKCQVVIPDEQVSRLHAWVGWGEAGQLSIEDRKSANGTYVNGTRVPRKALVAGDVVAFGPDEKHLFRLMRVKETPPRAPQPTGQTELLNVAPPPPPRGSPSQGTSAINMGESMRLGLDENLEAATIVDRRRLAAVSRPHVELIVDKYVVRSLDIPESGLCVGRDARKCHIQMEHPTVSALHAMIALEKGEAVLKDLSTNGSFVNGKRVPNTKLNDGDYITFGRYAGKSLIFRMGQAPALKIEKVTLDKDRITIGRDRSNDVWVNHPTVSSKHAEVIKQNGRYVVVDLGSTNGTFVNGIKVKRHQLQQMDRIVVGPSELRFEGLSLSHQPSTQVVRLDVLHLSKQVLDRATGQPRLILDDISLAVNPRELIGLLGPSGAGKSTLMDAMNGFRPATSGQVRYNGADLIQNFNRLKTNIGYVPQEDIVHRQLTVRKCLFYAAKIRLAEDISDGEIHQRITEMLETLKISERADTPVSQLSGGQRKRVSIGIELLPKPGVLFLDEPTSGLDPRTETVMMMLFRQLANQGSTIIVTTHLLASFGLLDKVVVLVQGRLAFYGPGGKFLEYFKSESPADVYDDLTENNTVSYSLKLKERFEKSDLHRELVVDPLRETMGPSPSKTPDSEGDIRRGMGFNLTQFKVLTQRYLEIKFKDSAQTVLLLVQAPVVALLVALMASGPNQVQTLFMAVFSSLWFGCSNAVREIVDEQAIYRRERQTGLKIPSYIFSKLAVLSGVSLVQCVSVVFVLMVVGGALRLGTAEALQAVVIMFLVSANGTLIGLTLSAMVGTAEKALTLFPLILIPELLLCGLFLPIKRIPMIPIPRGLPLTVEELFEGQIYAQPEAKARAGKMMAEAAPQEPAPSGPVLGGAVGPQRDRRHRSLRESEGGIPQVHADSHRRHVGSDRVALGGDRIPMGPGSPGGFMSSRVSFDAGLCLQDHQHDLGDASSPGPGQNRGGPRSPA